MSRKKPILMLVHSSLVPPAHLVDSVKQDNVWQTEYEVQNTLCALGHNVLPIGIDDDLNVLQNAIRQYRPSIAFNLTEEFNGISSFDQNLVSFLELIAMRYTGCNPRGLMLARDKAMAKKILTFHKIPTPAFEVHPRKTQTRRTATLEFPLIVKSTTEEASLGISQASIVYSDAKLEERVRFIHEVVGSDALVEQYIDGRELYIGLLGNRRVETLPVWELRFDNLSSEAAPIATRRAKWNESYRRDNQIHSGPAEHLSSRIEQQAHALARKTYKALHLSGYARVDFRLDKKGQLFVLEANPNPHIGINEDFAKSASERGFDYPQLLDRILRLGLDYKAA